MQSNDKVDLNSVELHLYKSRLQQYVQKNHFSCPSYTSEFDGPPHCRRFKASVTIDGRTYQCSEHYPTMKDAEHAAAKAALAVKCRDCREWCFFQISVARTGPERRL